MISKQEYRKYLLKQMSDDKVRKQREKEQRLGVTRTSFIKVESKATAAPSYQSRTQLKPEPQYQPKGFYNPKPVSRATYLGITKQFNIQIASSSTAHPSQQITPQPTNYPKYPSKYQTQSHSQQSDYKSQMSRPLSPRETYSQGFGRGRNLLAMENMDPHKIMERERKKSEMQRFLLQQMNQKSNNKTVQKNRRIEEERKLQKEIERYGVFESEEYSGGANGRRRGKKMVTMEAYFPETNERGNRRAESEEESTRGGYYSKALSEEKIVVQGYPQNPKQQSLKSEFKPYNLQANRFLTQTQQQFSSRPPIPSTKYIPHKPSFSHKDSLQNIQQQLPTPRSNHPKAPTPQYIPPPPRIPSSRPTSNHINPGYNYKMGLLEQREEVGMMKESGRHSEKESDVMTVGGEERYDQIGEELRKVRKEIMEQREMMKMSLMKVGAGEREGDYYGGYGGEKKSGQRERELKKQRQRQSPSSKHPTPRVSQKYIHLPAITSSNYRNPTPKAQPQQQVYLSPPLDQSQLFCQSKRIPIMTKQGQQTLTMSRIDDFALGENSFQRHIQSPSFMSKNQFIDPGLKRQQSRNRAQREQMQAISESSVHGDNYSQKRYQPMKKRDVKQSSNYKVYYQTDD